MSKHTLSTCLVLAPLLSSSMAAAESASSAGKPRETAAKAPETAAPARPEPASLAPGGPTLSTTAVRGSAQPASSPLHTESRWYGGQTLALDAASLALLVAAVATSDGTPDDPMSEGLAWASLGTFVGGGPIVHFAHGNVGKGLGSLALRAGLPIGGAFLVGRASATDCGLCGLGAGLLGGLAGIAGAIAIDAAVLGYEPVPERTSSWPLVGVASDGKSTLLTASGRF